MSEENYDISRVRDILTNVKVSLDDLHIKHEDFIRKALNKCSREQKLKFAHQLLDQANECVGIINQSTETI